MNAEDFTGQSTATKVRRERGQAAKANSGPGARPRIALQRRPSTRPAPLRIADAAAVTAPDTLANPTNLAYRRRLNLNLNLIPPVASAPR